MHNQGTYLQIQRVLATSPNLQHGSFGSAGLSSDELYSTGSEDFRGYVWKIPNLSELMEKRIEVSYEGWVAQEWTNTIGQLVL